MDSLTSWTSLHSSRSWAVHNAFQSRSRRVNKGVTREWYCRAFHVGFSHAAATASCLSMCLGLVISAISLGPCYLALGSIWSGRIPTCRLVSDFIPKAIISPVRTTAANTHLVADIYMVEVKLVLRGVCSVTAQVWRIFKRIKFHANSQDAGAANLPAQWMEGSAMSSKNSWSEHFPTIQH